MSTPNEPNDDEPELVATPKPVSAKDQPPLNRTVTPPSPVAHTQQPAPPPHSTAQPNSLPPKSTTAGKAPKSAEEDEEYELVPNAAGQPPAQTQEASAAPSSSNQLRFSGAGTAQANLAARLQASQTTLTSQRQVPPENKAKRPSTAKERNAEVNSIRPRLYAGNNSDLNDLYRRRVAANPSEEDKEKYKSFIVKITGDITNYADLNKAKLLVNKYNKGLKKAEDKDAFKKEFLSNLDSRADLQGKGAVKQRVQDAISSKVYQKELFKKTKAAKDEADLGVSWVIANKRFDHFVQQARVALDKAESDIKKYDDAVKEHEKGGFQYFDQTGEKERRDEREKQVKALTEKIDRLEKKRILATKFRPLGKYVSDWESEKKTFYEELKDARKTLKESPLLRYKSLRSLQGQSTGFMISSDLARQLRKKKKSIDVSSDPGYLESFRDYQDKSSKALERTQKAFYMHSSFGTDSWVRGARDTAQRKAEREELYQGVVFRRSDAKPGTVEIKLPNNEGVVKSHYNENDKKVDISINPPGDKAILIMLDGNQALKRIRLQIPTFEDGKKATTADIDQDDMMNVLKTVVAAKLRGDKPPVMVDPEYQAILSKKFPDFDKKLEAIQTIPSNPKAPGGINDITNPRDASGKRVDQQFSLEGLVKHITEGLPLAAEQEANVRTTKSNQEAPPPDVPAPDDKPTTLTSRTRKP